MVMELARPEGAVHATAAAHASEWVPVAEAAHEAGVSTSTVRRWYRSARLATARADEGGAFLVPIDDVLRLADAADAEGDEVADTVIDINAAYWSAETEAARAAAAAAVAEADRLRDALDAALARSDAAESQVTFLREQVAEFAEEERVLRGRIADLEVELASAGAGVPGAAGYASLTDHAWLDDAGEGYRGPQRPQERSGSAAPEVEGVDDEVVLADLRPVDEDTAVPDPPTPVWRPSDFGNSADDLLPSREQSRRRR